MFGPVRMIIRASSVSEMSFGMNFSRGIINGCHQTQKSPPKPVMVTTIHLQHYAFLAHALSVAPNLRSTAPSVLHMMDLMAPPAKSGVFYL